MRSPFPVITVSGSGFFESGDTKIDVDKKSFAGGVSGKLILADTPLVDITKAVNFLANYPHGCLEQVISSAWPFLVLPNALSEIDPLLVNSDAVRLKTGRAISRVQSMQLYDGSFVRWAGDARPYNWGSVYAAHFLTEARKAGVEYPEEMLRSSVNWLRQLLPSIPGGDVNKFREMDDFTTKAYAVYVLALNGEKPLGWIHYLKENIQYMWPSGRIWLAGAEAVIDGRADALRGLGTFSGFDGDEAQAPEALHETLDSSVRNAAQLLSMWAEVEPRSVEAVKLVQFLLDSGRKNNWHSTQENSAVAMALGRYLLRAGYEKGQLEATLSGPGGEEEKILSFRSGEKKPVEVAALPDSPLTLRAAGTGTGYYTWHVTGSPAAAPNPAASGLNVSHIWEYGNGARIEPGQDIPHGAKIFVTLMLTPMLPVRDVAVSYLLPAGMEIDNPRLIENPRTIDEEHGRGQDGTRYDVRDDRLVIFIDDLTKESSYRFVMRAVTRGSFAVPPLAAEAMYNSGVHFVGESGGSVTIK
ncbi:MAG: hypothetical protein FWG71_08520 [Synergistaceae bacterium]|nr:hypothetical protein [Synergistaceae bacterium]